MSDGVVVGPLHLLIQGTNSWDAAHFGEILQVRMLSTLTFDIVNAGADAGAEGFEEW